MSIDDRSASLQRRRAVLACGLWACACLYASVLIRFPNNFFVDDSYFYFQVAYNAAHHLGSTFNGIVPTNGYHPLWMLLCIAVFKVGCTKNIFVVVIGVVIALLNLGALHLLSRVCSEAATGIWWVPFLLYMPFSFLSQLGTEGALSGFLIALLVLVTLRLAKRPSLYGGFCFALAGSLAVLARLDNIFVVALIWVAVLLFSPIQVRSLVRRSALPMLPLNVALWGTYIVTNWLWFGTVQPISGILKARSYAHSHLTTPPHVAFIALAIIVPGVIVLALFRCDVFFKTVEAPFALGVLIHAAYLRTVMGSGETRWTWYYTAWMLLASIMIARVLSVLVEILHKRSTPRLRRSSLDALGFLSVLALLLAWFPLSYRTYGHAIPESIADGYQQNLSDRLHLNTVIAFDKPGRMAFFTNVQVVPLDGLMGDLHFQQELSSKGIAAFDSEHNVMAFVGPPQPLFGASKPELCDALYLGSTKLHCIEKVPGAWTVDRVEVFARLNGSSAGSIYLDPRSLVWNKSGQVAVWLISPSREK